MIESRADVLERVAIATLEQCAFLMTEPGQALAQWRAKDPVHCIVALSGAYVGWVRMSAPRELLGQLACDMIGSPPGDAEALAQGEETLKELTNVIAGVVVAELFGAIVEIKLGIPRTRTNLPAVSPRAQRTTVTLITEKAQALEVELVVVVEDPA